MVSLEELLLGKPIFRIRQKGVPPLLLPASMLQLPRCLVRICNLDSHDTTLFELDSFKNAIAAGKPDSKIIFASQTWAARPHLGSIFVKLLHRKTFCLPAARYLETMLLKKTVFRIRQKGVPPLLLPTSVLQLPRCLVRICNLDSHDTTLFELDSFKNAIAAGKPDSKIIFASQTWATRPHLGSIFVKLLHRKTFQLPAARILQPIMVHLVFDSPAS